MTIRPLKESLKEPEKGFILHALSHFGGNRQQTAAALDINRTTLYNKMKEHGIASCVVMQPPDDTVWNPNRKIAENRDGTVNHLATIRERAVRRLPVPWTTELERHEATEPPVY